MAAVKIAAKQVRYVTGSMTAVFFGYCSVS